MAKEKEPVKYVSTERQTTAFSILIKGQYIESTWSRGGREKGVLEWVVPAEMVEHFEMHHHFKVGNIKRAEDTKAAEEKADKPSKAEKHARGGARLETIGDAAKPAADPAVNEQKAD